VALGPELRVLVDPGKFQLVLQVVEKPGSELLRAGRPKPDRIRDAAAIHGNPIVRAARRQVEQVARAHDPITRGTKTPQYPQRRARDQFEVALPAHAPAPPAFALEQEYIVVVEMGADAAPGGCVTHHDVVESRVRNEREAIEQAASCGQCLLDPLHQQRPAPLWQSFQLACAERSMPDAPAPAIAENQAGFQVVPRGQLEQPLPLDDVAAPWKCIAHQQGLFLPVAAQKLRRRKAGERRCL